LATFLEKTREELDTFFEFKAPEPLLFLLDSRADLNLIWGRETESWFVGAFKNNSIYILNPDAYARESSHKPEEFWTTLKHEYCHYYYTQLTKSHYPVWLNEGLASFISGKKILLNDSQNNKLLDIIHYFEEADKDVYAVGQFWVEYLLKRYGRKKFLSLIRAFRAGFSYRQFVEKFHCVYGVQFTKKSFLKFLK